MAHRDQRNLPEILEIAKELSSLSGEPLLQLKQLKSYAVLERKTSKSDVNKNAVSVLRESVVFMLSDGSLRDEAKRLGLDARPGTAFAERLSFPTLTLQDVRRFPDYFARLTRDAMREAERLQTPGVSH